MKIGIITEGKTERQGIENLTRQLDYDGVSIVKPLYAPMQPKAREGQIVKSAESRINILKSKGCQRIIVIIDFEDQNICVVERAQELEKVFVEKGHSFVKVVVKNRQFENWIISDYEGIGKCKDFSVTKSFINHVEPNKADNVSNPVELLNKIKNCKKKFDKNRDVDIITKKSTPERIASNSRSFRRFLRLLKHPIYKKQSKIPG